MHRDMPSIALRTPNVFAYSAHAPASEKTEVLVQSTDGGPPRSVYTDDRGGVLADLSADGKRALFARNNSDQDVVLFEIDTGAGKATWFRRSRC